MKNLFIFAMLSAPAFGQVANPSIIPVTASPAGNACAGGLPDYQTTVAGVIYTCQNGSLAAVSGGGGGSITGVTAGTGITGGGTTGNVTVNVDTTKIAQLTSVSSLPKSTYSIVTPGDSRTAGSAITPAIAWPAILQTLTPISTQSTGTTNKGVAGNTMTNLIATYASSGTQAICQAATANNPVIMLLMDGVNDMTGGGLTAEATYSLYLQYMNQAKTDGCTPVAMTDLPAIFNTSGYSANHVRFNTLIRNGALLPGSTITTVPWTRVIDLDELNIDPGDHSLMNGVIGGSAVSGCSGCANYVNGDTVNINSYGAQGGTCTIGGVSGGVPTTCTIATGGTGYNPDVSNLSTTNVTHPTATGMTVNIAATYDQVHQSPQAQYLIAQFIARQLGGNPASQANASSKFYPTVASTGGYKSGDLVAPNGTIWLNLTGTSYFSSSGALELFQTPGSFGTVLGDAVGTNSLQIYSSTPAVVANINSAGAIFGTAYGQTAANNTGGKCTMATATTCTVTLGHTYTSPVCIVTEQGTGATVLTGACGVTGTTATVTATAANSATWGVFVFGNPN